MTETEREASGLAYFVTSTAALLLLFVTVQFHVVYLSYVVCVSLLPLCVLGHVLKMTNRDSALLL